MSTQQEKEELRQRLLDTRSSLSESEFEEASESIIARLQTLPEIRQSRTLHCYVSMNSRREVDTHFFLRWMLASNKRVIVPITYFEATELKHVELHSFEDLQPNKWGVLEPSDGKEVSPRQLDLVIVPMVGADLQCNRIGYGKGFYDRFLAGVNCPTVGLCFEECIVDRIPTESFDVSLSAVVTEERVIKKK
ncbi:5-formyltetrahydrofolate cyclo-ligase [Aliifodinibius sp. S!AR15-10]|uniref:5-formyltetrahydrofolate cyclo-ligase n=1 Tax=Aliifodinibius sp. S!AR15-10 TaxID=2950437 RepID=UPI00285DCACC|nr:5-formyltetrahydrofolate cyclo-ligase [Aliifodinibius sp. S!AR15-10]MDR8392354.1 5-formyltetrahydrofolate cyclo-ligase [Aliifodinibius sp. S!AR15-10]